MTNIPALAVRPVRVPVSVLVPVAAALAVLHQVLAPVPAADWIDQTVKKLKVSHGYLNTFRLMA